MHGELKGCFWVHVSLAPPADYCCQWKVMAGIGQETSTNVQIHDVALPELGRELGHPPWFAAFWRGVMGKRDAVCCHPGRKQGVVFLAPFKIMIVFVCSFGTCVQRLCGSQTTLCGFWDQSQALANTPGCGGGAWTWQRQYFALNL